MEPFSESVIIGSSFLLFLNSLPHKITTQRCGSTSWAKDGIESPFVIMAIGATRRFLPWSNHYQDIGSLKTMVVKWLSIGASTEEVQNYGVKVGVIHLLDTTPHQLEIFSADGIG